MRLPVVPIERDFLPRLRAVERQKTLFETRSLSHGMARYLVGDFVEEMLANMLGGARLATDSRCFNCPDIALTKTDFVEAKAVGRNGEAIIYRNRLLRDRAMLRKHRERSLCIAFVCHDCPVAACSDVEEMYHRLSRAIQRVVVVDFASVYSSLRASPVKLLNKAYSKSGKRVGWGSRGYGRGWNVSLSDIACGATVFNKSVKALNYSIANIPVLVGKKVTGRILERLLAS